MQQRANWDTSLLGSGLHYGTWGSMNPAVMNLRMLAVLQEQQRLEHRPRHGAAAGFVAEPRPRRHGQCSPGFGKCNAAIAVRANFFALKYPKDVVLYDYPVVIAPNVVAPYLHEIAHDWTQRLVSRSCLTADFSATVSEGLERVYTVKVLEPKELMAADLDRYLQGEDVNYNALPIISAFNLVTTAHTGVPDKKGYLFPPAVLGESPLALSAGLEAWKVFFASMRSVYKNLMVNINVFMGAFYVPNARLSDAMVKYKQTLYGASNPQNFLPAREVATKHLDYHRKSEIKASGSRSARKTVFQCDELGGMVSVEQYFQRNFNICLQHAGDFFDIFVPAELCEIEPGQSFADMLSGSEAAEMTKYSTNLLYINAKAITEQGIGILGLRIEFSIDMAFGPARLLSPPKVIYSSGPLTVANGSWNTRDDFRYPLDSVLRGFVIRLLATCRVGGMQVDDALPPLLFVRLPQMNPRDPLRAAAIDARDPGLKKLCDSKLGTATVCMQMASARKDKLGGVNHQLDASSVRRLKNTMLVGMDLTHPGVGCMISGVKQMMIERLNEYLKHMKTLPERVVVFRGRIKAAFCSFKSYSPELAIAICRKQHRTRLYPTRLEQAGKISNTKAGTLVDRGVTAVYSFDFFLQAHVGEQGTVHNRFSADNIQQGAHDASHLWAPILPPPPDSRESAMDEAQILRRAKELWGMGVHENLWGSMSYL
ncbi:Piwi-domain-containing protein [Phellopilus nigrolimitatus]|nr:Piwi-domain-containing protein [Phellopilus nigrolimitatus]